MTLVDPAANAGIERYSYSSLVAGTTIQSGSGRYTKNMDIGLGGDAMKNILKIMLMMITIFTIAGSAV